MLAFTFIFVDLEKLQIVMMKLINSRILESDYIIWMCNLDAVGLGIQ